MNVIYRIWWRLLMDLRPVVRYSAERFPHLAPLAVRLRTLAHVAAGNPLLVFAGGYGWLVAVELESWKWGVAVALALAVLVELAFQLARARGGPVALVWLMAWREAWRVRRRWPADWAAVAAKTTRVQAEVGTSREPIASARLRPIADHPKMSWWPRISWPVVTWWVGPPPGRSFVALEEVAMQLAANISHCVDVTADFDRESDSHGRLVVTFLDPLAETILPADDDGDGLELVDLQLELPTASAEPAPDRRPELVPDDGWEDF